MTDTFLVKELNVPYFVNTHHFHKDYEIVFVKESTGKRIVGDHVEAFSEGDIVLVGPDLPHAWFNDKEYYEGRGNLLARSVVVYLKKAWLEKELLRFPQTARLKNLLDNAYRGIKFVGESQRLIGQIASRIYAAEGLQKSVDLLAILCHMSESRDYQLLATANYLTNHNEHETARLNQVYEYVMRNFSSQITLGAAANVANMTANAFSRYFKKQTQKNFSHFVNEIRVGHACRLLQKKDLNIAQVCYESGFQSVTNFNKFFRRLTGKSPLEYRKQIFREITMF
ncbi:AraC family transcriptional regulator [Larkinella harenae]